MMASEHMRNWLTKPKKPQSHPVSFTVFKQLIENLPDIAFEIQIHELGFNMKTLDECANWYYNSFYTDPSVRTKYQYTLRPCPLGIREKLLRLPEGATSSSSSTPINNKNEAPPQMEEDVEVSVKNCGLFQFPVSFATFEKYIDSGKIFQALIKHWVKGKEDPKAMLGDEKTRRLHLRKYYNAFYVYPHKRHLDKYNFKNAPPELLPQLLKSATPLDERAKKMMSKAPARVDRPVLEEQSDPANSLSSVVSFPVFEKNVKNLYDIVWQLKLHEPAYMSKGFEDCAFAYYLAFYLTPEIRKKYPPKLRHCEASLHDRILAVPSQSDAATLQQMQQENGDLPTTQDLELQSTNAAVEHEENPRVCDQLLEGVKASAIEECTNDTDKDERILIPIEGITYQYPVSFETFMRSINKEELKPQLFNKWNKNDTDQPSENRLWKCFYHTFYVQKKLRKKFNYNFDSAPPNLRRKLNGMAIPLDSKTDVADQARAQTIEVKEKSAKDSAKTVAIVEKASKKANPLNAANVISPVEVCEASKVQKHQTVEALYNRVVPSDGEQDVVINLPKVGRFRLPISFETFKRHINYDELIKPLLSRVIQDESQLVAIAANPVHQQCIKIFQRYYNSFYVRPHATRSLYQYRFENVSDKLLNKLREIAEPLDEAAKKVMAEDAKIDSSVTEQPQPQPQQKIPDEQMETYPISFNLFKKYITNLDSIVEQMQHTLQYKDKSTSECALTYYKAFYKDAAIREKFEYRLKACPAPLRRKILEFAVPKEAGPETTKPTKPQAEKPVEQAAKTSGDKAVVISERILISVNGTIYEFPVSLETFKIYINYEKFQHDLAKCYSKNGNVLSDERSLALFRDVYYSFYIDRKVRNKCKFNFDAAPVDVRSKLLQFANPVKTVSKEAATETRDAKCTISKNTSQVETSTQVVTVISPVDAGVVSKKQDHQDAEARGGQSSDESDLSGCELNVIVSLARVGRFCLPISFETFKRHINYGELIKPLLSRVIPEESQLVAIAANPVHQQCIKIFQRYYNSFYVRPHATRSLYQYRFENVSDKLLNKLMEIAEPLDEAAKKVMAEDAKIDSSVTEQPQPQPQQQIPDNEIETYPVSFNFFKKYITNLESIVEQMQHTPQYKDKSTSECALTYYKAFYKDAAIREKFEYRLKACPAQLRRKILGFAVPKEAGPETTKPTESRSETAKSTESQSVTTKPTESQSETTKLTESHSKKPVEHVETTSGDKAVVISQKILIKLGDTMYEFPVSLQTFKRYINYDIIQNELANCYTNNANERSNGVPLQRFYHSFYTDRNARKVCNFNFDAAPIVFRSQLLQFAVPVEKVQPEKIESDERFPYPVSFSTFSNVLNMDEIVQEMKQDPEFSALSEKQCRQAYYKAFYRTPEIRNRFRFIIKPCQGFLKEKLLEIPVVETASRSSSNTPTFESLDVLYAVRKAELEKLQKENIIDYKPHNLADYVAHSTQCLWKRAFLQNHFIVKSLRQKVKESSETVTVTREATKKSVQQSAESVAAVEGTISKKATTQDTSKSSATSHDTAKVSASSSSSTSSSISTRSLSSTDVSRKEQSQQSNKPSTVASSQSTTCNVVVPSEAGTEKSSRDSIEATNRAVATIFFSKSGREHNMKYLLYTSHGLRKTLWRILAQLTYPEFRTYTGIHEFHKEDENMLCSFYDHVINKGNWPLNLYVKLPLLRQLLQSKGIQVDTLDFGKLSPKILHWHELIRFSNFYDIAKMEYERRTGYAIDDLQSGELDQFYAACWQSDQWIYGVPQIQADKQTGISNWSDTTPDVSESNAEPILPPCLIDNEELQESIEIITADELSDSECPATQLNMSLCPASFVDIDNVCPASQAVDNVDDPLLQQTIIINQINDSILSQDEFIQLDSSTEVQNIKEEPINFPNMLRFDLVNSSNEGYQCEPILTEEKIINLDPDEDEALEVFKAVKKEPVKFLNAMRFALNSDSNDGYECERIPTKEQIIDLDDDQSVAEDLECFLLPDPKRSLATSVIDDDGQAASSDAKYQDLMRELHELSDVMQTPSDIGLTPEDVTGNCNEEEREDEASNPIDEVRASDEGDFTEELVDRSLATSGIDVAGQAAASDNKYQDLLTALHWFVEEMQTPPRIRLTPEDVSGNRNEEEREGEASNPIEEEQAGDEVEDITEALLTSPRNQLPPDNFPNMPRLDLVNSSNEGYQCEPITEEQITNLDPDEDKTPPTLEVSKAVKQEPVKFLNAMRFALNSDSNDGYQCERISTEEQIIHLDNDQSISEDLACFLLPDPNKSLATSVIDDAGQAAASDAKYQDLLRELHELPDEMQDVSENVSGNWNEEEREGEASDPIDEERARDELEDLTDALLTSPRNQLPPDQIAREPSEGEQSGDEDPTEEMPNSERVEHQKPTTIRSSHVVPLQVSVGNPMYAPPVRPQAIKKKLPTSYPSKRPRLNADFVPQLRHVFRPLPLQAMVRVETEAQPDAPEPGQPSCSGSASGQETNPMTASQELSTDNTLMASSQLQSLLDAPFVTLRKVNANEDIVIDRSDNTDRSASVSPYSSLMLHTDIVFRCLQRYMYFDSLTTAQISKYQINSLSLGSSYQQALINANGKLCNVYGPLLENLFPHCTPSLMTDLQFLLSNVGEFSYNSRRDLTKSSKEDLRQRVLDMFMRTAPAFAHLHLRFENESRSWADCTPINERERDFQLQQRKPSCDLPSQIRPEILEQMRELKNSLYFK